MKPTFEVDNKLQNNAIVAHMNPPQPESALMKELGGLTRSRPFVALRIAKDFNELNRLIDVSYVKVKSSAAS
jgi:hypothetical protein